MHIRPADLPELRDETVAGVARSGQNIYERAIETGRQLTVPRAPTRTKAAEILAEWELRRLVGAELFHVSAEMSELAVAAGATLPEFTLMPEDIPTPNGFIFFAKPIATVDYRNDDGSPAGESPIVAAAWGNWTGGNPNWIHGGIWVTWYADSRTLLDNGVKLGLVDPKVADRVRPTTPRLTIDNEIQSPFSPNPIPAIKSDGRELASIQDADGLAHWLAILKAAWLLMQQPVTSVTDAQFDKATRRRLAKTRSQPSRVRVITLRRPVGGSANGSGHEYHHQWVVRGHWRQQWYPTREVHRPVWIAPHIKGPDGAPLLGGEKVYAWTR